MNGPGKITVVVVHGAWADGSSWKDTILGLEREGLRVVAAPIPLTSLSDDSAALKRAIARTEGPVILAGHAYAGAVIASANDERVKALVYIAALAPDEGETVAQVFYKDEKHPQSPKLAPDGDGFIWMPDDGSEMLFTACDRRTNRIIDRCPAADFSEVYSRAGCQASVEIQALLVPDCGRGPHDQSQDATFHGRTNGSNDKVARRRSHTIAKCATEGRRHHPGSKAGSVFLLGG